mmetsp:Transcript_2383/g.6001  ORF Transcript_2383/g.6001 Transcript_2383/m.6001 type:complete len:290 (+) Transcript_2383:955-1824(+)
MARAHQAAVRHGPHAQRLVKRPGGHVLAVGRERHAVHALLVPPQRVHRAPAVHVPQLDRGVKRRGGQQQRQVRVGAARARGAPADGVDLALVLGEVVHARVALDAPHLGGAVVGARRQPRAAGVPLDGVDLVLMARERLERRAVAHAAHVDLHVCGAGGERGVVAPVHVQGGGRVEGKDLLGLPRLGVPHDGALVHTAAQQQVALAVPLERKDGPAVLVQRLPQLAVLAPDARQAVVRPGGQQRAVAVPVQRGHVLLLVGLHLVQQRHRLGVVGAGRQVPDARGRVTRP